MAKLKEIPDLSRRLLRTTTSEEREMIKRALSRPSALKKRLK
jgi:hypothetical protein